MLLRFRYSNLRDVCISTHKISSKIYMCQSLDILYGKQFPDIAMSIITFVSAVSHILVMSFLALIT